jgi:hypothetical protein
MVPEIQSQNVACCDKAIDLKAKKPAPAGGAGFGKDKTIQ